MVSKSPKHYARMIRDHVKSLPDQYAEDPKDVKQALGLTDEEFELGLTFCISKKIIVMEKPQAAKPAMSDEVVMKRVSPVEDETLPEKILSSWDDNSPSPKKISTMEMMAASVSA